MPSPVGHALAGFTAGWLIAPPPAGASRPETVRRAALYALAAVAPDLDLLFGAHSGPTHGVGAAVLAGLVVWGAGRRARWRGRTACAVAAACASHTLLDWLGSDSSAPIGIMALWPLTREHYESGVHLFLAISRRYWLAESWMSNLRALARELAILGPLAVLAWRARRPGRGRGDSGLTPVERTQA